MGQKCVSIVVTITYGEKRNRYDLHVAGECYDRLRSK
jgi:hypothetical protein